MSNRVTHPTAYNPVHYSRRILTGLLAACALGASVETAPCAAQGTPDIFTTWQQEQSRALATIERIEVRTTSHLELVSGPATRRVESVHDLRLDRGRGLSRTLVSLAVDGEEVDPQRREQIERGVGGLGGPAVSRLSQALMLPTMILQSARFAPRSQTETTRDGTFFVVRGRIEEGPDARGRRQRPGRAPVPLPGPPPPPQRQEVTLWFNADTGHLAVMEHRITMERGRGVTVRSEMSRVDGLDVPVRRTVRGEVRSPRRLRSVTVEIFQEADFHDYVVVR